jgi:phosphoribosyl-ATP pyrophosphohydrolase
MASFTLADLAATISARARTNPETSYTASLINLGAAHCARKFGEESVEAIVAAVEGDRDRLTSEAADVLFHLLVLLEATGTRLDEVMTELEKRSGQSGHAEKASRSVPR